MSARRRRGAIVGFGFIAENGHLPAYAASNELEIVAVADVSPERRVAAHRALPNARIFEDHRALLAHQGASLDFIDVTTPPYAHATVVAAALEYGLHVLCEKPLATTVRDARAVVRQAERRKRVLLPAHNYKHAPVIKAVRSAIESNVIGRVNAVTLNTFRTTHARGVREWSEHWRREKRYSGGGIAMDHGPHTLYLAFEWLRSYPTSMSARMATRGTFDTEDTVAATLTFPTGIATAHLTWTANVRKVIYTLQGELGAIRVEDDQLEVTHMAARDDGPPAWNVTAENVASAWADSGHATWFSSLLEQFVTAMDTGDFASADAEDAVRCIEAITAAYASSRDASRERGVTAEA
jgi:predicted dehydrogenase